MRIRRVMVGTTAAVVAGLATACGSGGDGASVTRAQFEDDGLAWPFSLEEGSLHCDDGAVYFRARSGEEYALNDAAEESGYAAPDPVWLDSSQADAEDGGDDEVLLSPKVPLDDMAELGERECAA